MESILTGTTTSIKEMNEEEAFWLIDTDYSLDDQLALSILVGKINILAITVAGVNTDEKPNIIKRKIEDDLINKYGRSDIKVFAGADRPYINYQNELKDDKIFDPYNFKKTDYSSYVEAVKKEKINENGDIAQKISNIAAVKITEYVRLYEKKLNILTLGPLTNLSLAVLIDSTIRDKFNNLYITGGSYNNLGNSGNAAEYNFRADPVAIKNVIFYYKNITLIPLELEDQFIRSIDVNVLRSNNPNFKVLFELFSLLTTETEETRTRHSFLGLIAAIIILNANLITFKKIRPVDVDIIGRYTRGAMAIEKYEYLKSGKFKEITILEELDLEAFNLAFQNIIA